MLSLIYMITYYLENTVVPGVPIAWVLVTDSGTGPSQAICFFFQFVTLKRTKAFVFSLSLG